MPEKLTIEPGIVPFVKNLDGSYLKSEIAIEKDFEGCSGSRVCYSLAHSNIKAVPAGSNL